MIGPFLELTDVLQTSQCNDLLRYAFDRRDDFEEATVMRQQEKKVDPDFRKASVNFDVDGVAEDICNCLVDIAWANLDKIGVNPFDIAYREFSIVAHGEGAFFKRHADTLTGGYSREKPSMRAVSAIYYFHRDPKGFSDGQLRIYSMLDESYVDAEPCHNKLVMFPSMVPHEVLPVVCPSRKFEDSRFAINIWLHKSRQ